MSGYRWDRRCPHIAIDERKQAVHCQYCKTVVYEPFQNEIYSPEKIYKMLKRAEDLGYSLEQGSELEKLTLGELDELTRLKN